MKRAPATSVSVVIKAMQDVALGPPAPPAHVLLREGDRPFWDGVLCARARDEWTQADLVVAAQLARCQADIETETVALESEESVTLNARGTPVVNPRLTVLELLARREMALMRTLRMGGKVAGDPRLESGRRQAERNASAVMDGLADEELLAS